MGEQDRASAWDISFDDGQSQNSKLSQSFTSALRDKYCSSDTCEDQLYFVSQITITGKPKNVSQTELGYLRNVSLCEQNITKAELPPEGLGGLCPNVTDLDLSWNKLESWEEIFPILHQLKFLKHLNLAYNKLENANNQLVLNSCERSFPQIQDLNLTSTNVSWDDVEKLARLMPNLQELHLCLNGYTDVQICCQHLQNLECLRLNKNRIKSWDSIWKLHKLPKLKTLILVRNPIDKVVYGNSESWKACEEIVGDLAAGCNLVTGKGDGDSIVHSQDCDRVCKEVIEEIVNDIEVKEKKTEPTANKADPLKLEDLSGCELTLERVDGKYNTDIQDCVSKMDNLLSTRDEKKVTAFSKICTVDGEGDHLNIDSRLLPFPQLELINLSETQLSKWSDLKELSKFPKLCKVRIQKTNFMKTKSVEEKRKFILACLPNAKLVNGSEVSSDEREKSERHFLRYFVNEKKKPARYQELEKKHGKLEPFVTCNLMLDYIEWPEVKITYQGAVVFSGPIHAKDNVRTLRELIAKKTKLNKWHFKMYLHSVGGDQSLDELQSDNLPISRYNVKDGDEILVDKQKMQTPPDVWKSSYLSR